MPQSPYLGTREVAVLLGGTDVSTISRWVRSGELTPLHRLPGKRGAMMFARADIEQFATDLRAWERARLAQLQAELEAAS